MVKKRDYKIYASCNHCGKEFEIMVNGDDYRDWRNGEGLIQVKMPYLTAEEREIIMNQICTDCWDEMIIDWDYVKPIFLNYYRTQVEGTYNMVTQKDVVMKLLSINEDDYDFIQSKYDIMKKHFATECIEIDIELMHNLS